jgi:hypothetical protein
LNSEEKIFPISALFSEFQDGVRTLMLIDRGISNSNKGSRRWINKLISSNQEEWLKALSRLLHMQYYLNDPDIRLYASLNSRHLTRAVKMFQHLQLDLPPDDKDRFYTHINDSFISCLMKPENKASKYFLLDVDTKDIFDVEDFLLTKNIGVKLKYETPKGWHYIVEPFNVLWAEKLKDVTLQKDGLLLLNTL